MRKWKLNAIGALFAAVALAACGGGGGGGGDQVADAPPPAPAPGPAPAPADQPSAPVNSIGSNSVTVATNARLTFSSGNGNRISVDDVDGGPLTTSLFVEDGSLEMASGSEADITINGPGNVTIVGTIAQINAALDGMVYNAPSTAQTLNLQILTQDRTTPMPLSATGQIAINVEASEPAPNQSPPVNTVSRDSVTVFTTATLTFNSGNGNQISVGDVDGGKLTTVLSVSAGKLTMATNSGAGIKNNKSATVEVNGSIAQVNAALNGMVYTPPAVAQTVSFQIQTRDATLPTPLTDTDQVTIEVTVAEFEDGQDASVVWGQPGFDTGSPAAVGRGTLSSPGGSVAVSEAGMVYVPDTGFHRVLIFPEAADTGALASAVRGQPDFKTANDFTDKGTHPTARHVAIGGNRMAVADQAAHRVSLFSQPPTSNVLQPISLIGQSSFTSEDSGCGSVQLSGPRAVAITPDGSKVVVADTENHRVNIYNGFPLTLGAPGIDIVLGQATTGGVVHCDPNRGSTTAGRTTLRQPSGVWTDGTRLVVADTGNNRVLIWNSFPTVVTPVLEGSSPDLVLGQANFNLNLPNRGLPGASSVTLNGPTHVASDGTRLAVADTGNHRVLIWTTFPEVDSPPAQVVLGQLTMNGREPNRSRSGPGADTLHTPTGLHFNDGKLYVTDKNNHRILIYEPR